VPRLSFAELYKSHFALVWRNRRRLGVPEARLRDAAQDAFLVVHRRLSEFEGRGTVEAWLWSAAQPELSRSAQPV
jgi:RNA polymerase sigma-70 factor (ECF subfamily)